MEKPTSDDALKLAVARAARDYVASNLPAGAILGVGTGTTVNLFIKELKTINLLIGGTVASSEATKAKLSAQGMRVLDLNEVKEVPLYVDGADEIDNGFCMIKGGGGALTREKIVAAVAKKFVCICHMSKRVNVLGRFPLPVEVIPMARSYVSAEIAKLGGEAKVREGVVTDNCNIILDVHNLRIIAPRELESKLNQIAGVVTNGIFAHRGADVLLLGTREGVKTLTR